MSRPVLVAVAHGTARAAARGVVGTLVAAVRTRLPEVSVRLAHVDVQSPALTAVMGEVRAAGDRAVVVPLLLSAGFHVAVDIAAAVDPAQDVVTPTLAGDPASVEPVLVDLGLARLRAAGAAEVDAYVVAAAGSSRAGAREQVHGYAAAVAAATGRPATVGWVAGPAPDLDTVVRAATDHGRVGVVSYLLAPGVFAARAAELGLAGGAVAVGSALGPDPVLADLVVRRYRVAAMTAGMLSP